MRNKSENDRTGVEEAAKRLIELADASVADIGIHKASFLQNSYLL